VRLAAAEDADASAGIRQITVSAPGMTPVTVTATELDNDVCLCPPVITPTVLSVPEGGSAGFTIRLSAAPLANVTVTVSATSGGDPDLTICSGTVLTFTPANWQIPQTVTICAAEDADAVNGSRTFAVASIGVTPIAVTATEADNDLVPSKVDNPFANAFGYVNPDRQSQLNAEAANHPAALAAAIRAVGQQPTGLWLDRIAAITAGRGLAGHLDEALAQDAANGASPVVVTLVLYNLPNRSCAAPGGGELTVTGNGFARYRADFIDPIRAILARPQYANLRVAVVVEPDSLVTTLTHHQSLPSTTLRCIEAHQSLVYRDGIRYAINQLTTLPNSYLYVDISSSAWLGWEANFCRRSEPLRCGAVSKRGWPRL
jgi:cellulose 1,4-beta-cellobiosidase